MFSTLEGSTVIIAVASAHSLQAVGSVLSARFILQLRSYLTDLSMQSMSVPPEHFVAAKAEKGWRQSESGGLSESTAYSSASDTMYDLYNRPTQ
ncbi:hypothetical protein SCHPADRAFT_999929 [Schizopora paradoxa]|nr:hypothetical protein SCHPADRAFT_999929 [Schizopora paradoxa]